MKPRFAAFAGALCGFALLLAACGGSSKGSILSPGQGTAEPKAGFEVGRADELARAALLTQTDLPDFTANVINDGFDDTAMHKLAPCAEAAALNDDEAKVRSGRASRRLGRTVPNTTGLLQVSGVIEIYPTADQAKAFFDRARAFETGKSGLACFDAIFKDSARSLTITTKPGASVVKPQAGVAVTALDIDVTQPRITIHGEELHWLQGNAIINLDVSGPKDAVTTAVVQTAIEKQKAAAEDAARGARQRSP